MHEHLIALIRKKYFLDDLMCIKKSKKNLTALESINISRSKMVKNLFGTTIQLDICRYETDSR